MPTRRLILATAVATIAPIPLMAQILKPVRLLVVRRMGLSPANQCVAPCIRGSIYDISDQAGALDQTILPLLISRKPVCDVIERPWKDNASNISSIPKGIYTAHVRNDRTKTWMNNEDRAWRIELGGVSRRTAIQFHYGEDVAWSQGCFILGTLLQAGDAAGITNRYCKVENGEAAVAALRAAVNGTGLNPKSITIGVVDDANLFPGLQPKAPC